MKISRILITVGIILVVFGFIFQYQGRGMLGPESSFMYYNKEWIYYGIGIIVLGVTASGVGVFLRRH